MKILSIETSCDETAVSIIEADGGLEKPSFKTLSNLVLSQANIHEKYGGVFPSMAKREHAKNLTPLIKRALEEADLLVADLSEGKNLNAEVKAKIKRDLSHEPELFTALVDFLESVLTPKIDLIAVTFGPGLEPALWVGINAAKTLGEVWDIPVMPINHMEGHISSVFLENEMSFLFPAVALLISGGHTELVHVPELLAYDVVGETRDDAVGEAFDKVARMLGLSYPGGPAISALAEEARRDEIEKKEGEATSRDDVAQPVSWQKNRQKNRFNFPRPMLRSDNLDFSFSGLKTSVLYAIRGLPELNRTIKKEIALAFEVSVIETLVGKTKKALQKYAPKSLIIAGGVIANKALRNAFENLMSEFPQTKLLIPTLSLSTDNALMIAVASYVRYLKSGRLRQSDADISSADIRARGNARLE